MYRKLLYNNDCILNILTNTVIFNFEEDWKLYLDWEADNIEEVEEDLLKKNNILLWNGGAPKVEPTETGILSTLYDKSGNLVKKIDVSDGITTTEIFHSNGFASSLVRSTNKRIIYSSTYSLYGNIMNEVSISEEDDSKVETQYHENTKPNTTAIRSFHSQDGIKLFYDINGEVIKKEEPNKISYLYNGNITKVEILENNTIISTEHYSEKTQVLYKRDDHKLKIFIKFNTITGEIVWYKRNKADFEYEVYYDNQIKIKTILKKSNKLLKFIKYFDGMDSIDKKLYHIGNDMYKCSTYFTSGKLRGIGSLSDDNKMQDEWVFYHHNGNIESKHKFNEGKLIGNSSLFYENGNLYKEITHD